MTLADAQPFIPFGFEQPANGPMRDAVMDLSRLSLNQVRASMPPVMAVEGGVRYQLYVPPKDQDPSYAVVVPAGFALSADAASHVRNQLVQSSLSTRLVYFPNSRVGASAYSLSPQERAELARGNRGPIAERMARTLHGIGVERFSLYAHSQGTVTGAALGRLASERGTFGVETSTFLDPVTLRHWREEYGRRAQLAISLAVARRAVKRTVAAARDSAIPALVDAHHGRAHPLDVLRRYGDLAADGMAALLRANQALRRLFVHGGFADDLSVILASNPEFRATLVAGAQSYLLPQESFRRGLAHERLKPFRSRIDEVTVPGYGHEFPFNAVLSAILALRTLGGHLSNRHKSATARSAEVAPGNIPQAGVV